MSTSQWRKLSLTICGLMAYMYSYMNIHVYVFLRMQATPERSSTDRVWYKILLSVHSALELVLSCDLCTSCCCNEHVAGVVSSFVFFHVLLFIFLPFLCSSSSRFPGFYFLPLHCFRPFSELYFRHEDYCHVSRLGIMPLFNTSTLIFIYAGEIITIPSGYRRVADDVCGNIIA